MKAKLIIYRLITFILLPIAGLNALSIFGALPTAFSNPPILIGVCLSCAVIIYTFTSFAFFIKGVQNGKTINPALKDWIKVNAFVSIALTSLVIFIVLFYFSSSTLQKAVYDNLSQFQAAMDTNHMSKAELIHELRTMMIIVGIYSVVLTFHIIVTLQLIKKYNVLFNTGNNK